MFGKPFRLLRPQVLQQAARCPRGCKPLLFKQALRPRVRNPPSAPGLSAEAAPASAPPAHTLPNRLLDAEGCSGGKLGGKRCPGDTAETRWRRVLKERAKSAVLPVGPLISPTAGCAPGAGEPPAHASRSRAEKVAEDAVEGADLSLGPAGPSRAVTRGELCCPFCTAWHRHSSPTAQAGAVGVGHPGRRWGRGAGRCTGWLCHVPYVGKQCSGMGASWMHPVCLLVERSVGNLFEGPCTGAPRTLAVTCGNWNDGACPGLTGTRASAPGAHPGAAAARSWRRRRRTRRFPGDGPAALPPPPRARAREGERFAHSAALLRGGIGI